MNKSNFFWCAMFFAFFNHADRAVADWPTYLGSNTRAGWTDEKVKMPLQQTWAFKSPSAPKRAWSGPEGRTIEGKELRDRVKFDDALQVAIADGRVYFGSSVDHQVRCLDVKTGAELWSFFTDAPVRLAPTVADGRVFVGSDDGYAWCLDAANGKLLWKLRLGPANEQIIARGEMISRWPVRTSVLVDDGVAYFGAGIFPHENVYLCAARTEDGQVIWKNDQISHQDAGRNDLSPQGYLLATDDILYVPSSRTRPKAVHRDDGRLVGAGSTSLKFAETIIAGTDALIAGGRLHTYSLGTRLVIVGEDSYAATGKEVIRMNQKQYATANSKRSKITSEIRNLSRSLRTAGDKAAEVKAKIAKLQSEFKETANEGILWRAACTAEAALIVVGDLVFAGDKNKVTAFDNASGEERWSAVVDGTARGLAVADGNLVVSTTTGMVYCFGGEATKATSQKSKLVENPYPKDKWTTMYEHAAADILKNTGVTRGFCLVVGGEQGRLAFELAKRSELKIYAVESDEQKVQTARRALSSAGLYGHRVTVHQTALGEIPYSNYFANLIVSDSLLLTGKVPAEPQTIARHLKPAGGVICLGQPADTAGATIANRDSESWLKSAELANSSIEPQESWVTMKRGTLPGAGNWSHQYGEPGNTANSGDKRVGGGLGVLWYGDPGPDMMVNRHQGAVGPLVVNGRMFVQGEDNLMAFDAYNGLFLWSIDNPEAIRTGVFQNRNPGNLAASNDSLFHMARDTVYEHDMATGKIKREHKLPSGVDPEKHEWGYVAWRDGKLIGTTTTRAEIVELNRRRRGNPGAAATDSIFAIDTNTGKHLWAHQGQSINFQTIALGPDRVFFIDSTVTSEQRADLLRQDKSELRFLKGEELKRAEERMKKIDARLAVALDSKSGKEIWSRPVDVTDCSNVGIGGGQLTMMYHNDVLILCGANANGHYWKQFVSGEFDRRRLVALYALDGYKMWGKDANYRHRPIIVGDNVIAEPWSFDLKSGQQQTRVHPITGKDVPWSVMRPGHHCGMLTACDNLLLFRSGYTGFYDLKEDAGTRHFAGHRLGCWINAIPTNGLVVIPEASAGCVCMFSIASTIVMEPRTPRRPWSLFSGVGATTPVKQMSLNLGAPGDRRDENGKLWLAYPRPTPNTRLETSLDLKLKIETKFSSGGGFVSQEGDGAIDSSYQSWIVSSSANGVTQLSIPLLGKEDAPTKYNVRLIFARDPGEKPGQRVFDVKIQNENALEDVDVTAQSDDSNSLFFVRQVSDVLVSGNLDLKIASKQPNANSSQMPKLAGIEVTRMGE